MRAWDTNILNKDLHFMMHFFLCHERARIQNTQQRHTHLGEGEWTFRSEGIAYTLQCLVKKTLMAGFKSCLSFY